MVREPDSEAQGPASETDVRRRGERRRPATPCKLLLVVAKGDLALVRVNQGMSVVFGRRFPSDFSLDSSSVSRQHARFSFDDEGLLLEDLNSLNGTRVAGQRVSTARLSPGDVVEIGEARLLVFEPPPTDFELEILTYDELLESLVQESREGRSLALSLFSTPIGASVVTSWLPLLAAALRPSDRIALYAPNSLLVLTADDDEAAALTLPRSVLAVVDAELGLRVGMALSSSARSADELLSKVVRACAQATEQAPLRVAAAGQDESAIAACAGTSEAMQATIELARRVAAFDVPALIVGEPGTGKLVLGRLIHEQSPRKRKPLVVLSGSSSVPELQAAAERAAGGSMLVDEIFDLVPEAQAELVSLLGAGSGKLRLIATSHHAQYELADEHRFNGALWNALRGALIELPPLRQRQGDVELLSDVFLRELSEHSKRKRSLSANARQCLRRYPWPGNVRQLCNVIERAALVCRGGTIELDDLPRSLQRLSGVPLTLPPPPSGESDMPRKNSLALRERLREFEAALIREALGRAQGGRSKAAELLGIPLRTLNHKMKQLGIK